MANKPHMNLIFIGHVDHGKSTTVGRILVDTGSINEQVLKKLKERAAETGLEGQFLAYTMDELKEEQQRGVTIDLSHKKFETQKFYFTIIDAPGHRDFIKNMITGVSQADAAVLVCEAVAGVEPQTKEHIFLARTLGIRQMIVAINKMDRVEYKKESFEKVKKDVTDIMKGIGIDTSKVPFIPIASLPGEGVTKKSDKLSWYTGPCLLEAMDALNAPESLVGLPLRLPIQDVFTITGIGAVPVGRVETGKITVGDNLIFKPANLQGEVKSIEMHHEDMKEAVAGDNIGFSVKNVGKTDIRRGDVAGHTDKPPTVVEDFTAQIVVLNHPTVIAKGYTPVFHAHTAQVACTVSDILEKKDPRTGQTLEKNPAYLKTGDVAVIKCIPLKPMVLETQKEYPPLGRFAIRDMGQTVAAGMVIAITPKVQ